VENTPKTLASIVKVLFFMLCRLLRHHVDDVRAIAEACLGDYAHRYSKSHLKAKMDILIKIKEENQNDPSIHSSICQIIAAFLDNHDSKYLQKNSHLFQGTLVEMLVSKDEALKE